jgi:hypothetical protein
VQATGKEGVLGALGGAVRQFRERLGESLASIQRYDAPVEQASTSSLEALKAYSRGTAVRRTQGDFESVSFFKRAIELDPHLRAGLCAAGHGLLEHRRAGAGARGDDKAYELRERVSDRERYYIEARYLHHGHRRSGRRRSMPTSCCWPPTRTTTPHWPTPVCCCAPRAGWPRRCRCSRSAVRAAPGPAQRPLNLGYACSTGTLRRGTRRLRAGGAPAGQHQRSRSGLFLIATTSTTRPRAPQVDAVRGRRDELNLTGTPHAGGALPGSRARSPSCWQTSGRRAWSARDGPGVGEPTMGAVLTEARSVSLPTKPLVSCGSPAGHLTRMTDDEQLFYAARDAAAGAGPARSWPAAKGRRDREGRAHPHEDVRRPAGGGRRAPADAHRAVDPPLFQRRHAQLVLVWDDGAGGRGTPGRCAARVRVPAEGRGVNLV